MQTGIELITTERQRQIEKEGWTTEHDDQHAIGELEIAAFCYCIPGLHKHSPTPANWPWHHGWWKPSNDYVRNWTKAGALFLAERDRLQRLGHKFSANTMNDNAASCAVEIDREQQILSTTCAKPAPTAMIHTVHPTSSPEFGSGSL